VDAGGLCAERTPRGGADEYYAQDFALSEPPTSAGRFTHALARTGGEPRAVRLSAFDRDSEERRLAQPMQIALAGLLHHARNILLIPGTSSIHHLRENLEAAALQLPAETIAKLDAIAVGPTG
jgi:aryl-alcohol dehydrogenase-like predicted oxidoreductase